MKQPSSQTAPSLGSPYAYRLSRFLFIAVALLFLAVGLQLPKSHASGLDRLVHDGAGKIALLLTAHPDDEAMFFSPTLRALSGAGWDVHGLCLSTGNADGMGDERREELLSSFKVFGIPEDHVEVLDHKSLQDGMSEVWNSEVILGVLREHLAKVHATLIVTFDDQGVSGHPNHMALGNAVTQTSLKDTVQVLQLRSPPLYWKYTGPIYALIDKFVSHTQQWIQIPSLKSSAATLVSSPRDWLIGFKAMLEHRTQLVWFRWLYLACSQLMWINQLDIAT